MVRRPLLYMALSFASAIGISYYLGVPTALIAGGILWCILIISVRGFRNLRTRACETRVFGKKNTKLFIIALTMYTMGAGDFYLNEALESKWTPDEGSEIQIKGKVLQKEDRYTSVDGSEMVQIKAQVTEIDEESVSIKKKILIKYYGNYESVSAVPGDVFTCSGEVQMSDGRRNPGCFDYSLYLKSIGVCSIVKASSVETCKTSGRGTIRGRMYIIRNDFGKKLEEAAGEGTASMMRAVLFGDKTGMDEDVMEEFRKNGTAHVLAVSGLHVGMVYGFISFLWRWRKGKFYFVTVMLILICYMAMASFAPSVVRAVFMISLHLFSKVKNKRYDLSSAAFFSALVMMLMNPMCLFNTGFQMSYLAVLTISLMIPVIKRFYSGVFLGSAAAQLGLMPYTAYMFNYISLGAVFVNVIIIFIAGLIVPLGLCAMVFMLVFPPAFYPAAVVLSRLCALLETVNSVTAIDGFLVFPVVSPGKAFIAGYYLCLLFFLSEEGRLMIIRKKKKTAVIMLMLLMMLSFGFGKLAGDDFKRAELVFVDVGQGDCMHFRTEDGKNYMIDGGGSINYNIGKNTLKAYLLKNGVKKLDGVFVTHLHTDHYKGVSELCAEGMVKKLFIYEGNEVKEAEIAKETGMEAENIIYLSKGQTVNLSEEEKVQVMWPERKSRTEYLNMAENEEDENGSSLILKVVLKNGSFIATGDVDEECLDDIAEQWKEAVKCDVIKVAHHGSKYSYSDEFVGAVDPDYAVFQVGKNNYGHPDEGVIENYRQKGIMIYRNDTDGAIGFDFRKNGRTEVVTIAGEER